MFNNKTKIHYFENISIIITLSILSLITIGIICIYSASLQQEKSALFDLSYFKQMLFAIIGFFLFIFFSFYNYSKLVKYAWFFYFIGLLLLILVLIFGKVIHSSKSWLHFWIFSIQPSEFTKIFLILALAKYLSSHSEKIKHISGLFFSLLIGSVYIILIAIQPDIGTAMVYIPIILSMALIQGAKVRHIASIILIGVLSFTITFYLNYLNMKYKNLLYQENIESFVKTTGLYSFAFSSNSKKSIQEHIDSIEKSKSEKGKAEIMNNIFKKIKSIFLYFSIKIGFIFLFLFIIFYFFNRLIPSAILEDITLFLFILSTGFLISSAQQTVFKSHHINRIIGFTDLEKDPLGMNYNQRQSVIAIGSGGIKGHGLFKGPQTHLNYIPEKKTDFIFAVIGEELGLLGLILILALYFIIISQGFIIAYRSKDYEGSLIAVGILSMFFSHIFINIGMAIGIMPVMGIPLPFISSGGSSLITNLIGIGILISISKRRFMIL